MASPLIITPLTGFPLLKTGDDLVSLILDAIHVPKISPKDEDIFVVTQKIVSKAEGRLVNLATVKPSQMAIELANKTRKDARLVELILQESREILRAERETIIVEHRLGFVCANAGIDRSNVDPSEGEWVLLLPENPDISAKRLRERLEEKTGLHLGVLIIDTQGRAWRLGVVGMSIGLSGIPALVDVRGKADLYGNYLRITLIAAADELAAAASLMMGQAAEGVPVVHVRGFPYPLNDGRFSDLLRPRQSDLFR